jgi:hypothetical protein
MDAFSVVYVVTSHTAEMTVHNSVNMKHFFLDVRMTAL